MQRFFLNLLRDRTDALQPSLGRHAAAFARPLAALYHPARAERTAEDWSHPSPPLPLNLAQITCRWLLSLQRWAGPGSPAELQPETANFEVLVGAAIPGRLVHAM